MTETLTHEKQTASAWFKTLRDDIVAAFEALEENHTVGPFSDMAPGKFEVTETKRSSDNGSDAGGGLMSVLRGGRVFEKVGVNVSTVFGELMNVRPISSLNTRASLAGSKGWSQQNSNSGTQNKTKTFHCQTHRQSL